MKGKYPAIKDGEGIEIDIENKEKLNFACCDCGLVHTIAFAIEKNGKLGMALKRDVPETERLRKRKKTRSTIAEIAEGLRLK